MNINKVLQDIQADLEYKRLREEGFWSQGQKSLAREAEYKGTLEYELNKQDGR